MGIAQLFLSEGSWPCRAHCRAEGMARALKPFVWTSAPRIWISCA